MHGRRVWWAAAAGVFLVTSIFAVSGLTAQDKPPAAEPATLAPAAPHHFLMEWHGKAFDELNLALGKKKQEAAAQNAWLLAELANVNTLHSEQADYRGWAAAVRAAAADAAAAIAAKDFDKAKSIAKSIHATCEACHDKYEKDWKK